jgi:hypothetical protein
MADEKKKASKKEKEFDFFGVNDPARVKARKERAEKRRPDWVK